MLYNNNCKEASKTELAHQRKEGIHHVSAHHHHHREGRGTHEPEESRRRAPKPDGDYQNDIFFSCNAVCLFI